MSTQRHFFLNRRRSWFNNRQAGPRSISKTGPFGAALARISGAQALNSSNTLNYERMELRVPTSSLWNGNDGSSPTIDPLAPIASVTGTAHFKLARDLDLAQPAHGKRTHRDAFAADRSHSAPQDQTTGRYHNLGEQHNLGQPTGTSQQATALTPSSFARETDSEYLVPLVNDSLTTRWDQNQLGASTLDRDRLVSEYKHPAAKTSIQSTMALSGFELPAVSAAFISTVSTKSLEAVGSGLGRVSYSVSGILGNAGETQVPLLNLSQWQPVLGGLNPAVTDNSWIQSLGLNGPGGNNGPMAGWLKSVFNGAIRSKGLNVEFDRDAAIETFQQTWNIDQPRFGDAIGVQSFRDSQLVLATTNSLDFLGSGWSLDGTQPLMSIYDRTAREVRWYAGSEMTLVRTQPLGATFDLLGNAVPGKYYRPQAGIIHEGLHVVMTARYDVGASLIDGLAFFYTQDYGNTWTEVPNLVADVDPGILSQTESMGMNRGSMWSFANAFPHGSVDNPLDAWFPWGDYLRKEESPKGGQLGLFRVQRAAVGDLWTVRPNRIVWERWEPADTGGLHAHGLTIHPDTGVALSWWGDVGYRNEIVAHRFADLENYETSALEISRGAFGGYSPTEDNYSYSNQSAGFAPGPIYGSAIATADVNPERLTLASYDSVNQKVKLQPLYASSTNQGLGVGYINRVSLWIHHLRGVGYVAREMGAVTSGNDKRAWVSEDGLVWTKLQAKFGGVPVLFGEQILFTEDLSEGVLARPWHTVSSFSPLLVSPGGINLQGSSLDQRTAPGTGGSVRQVYVDSEGHFRYSDDNQLLTPQPSDAPPVSPDAPIYELSISGNRALGTRWLAPDGQTADLSQRHFWQGWVYPLESRGLRTSYRIGGAGSGNATAERGPDMMSNTEWMPSYHYGNTSTSSAVRPYLSLFQMNPGENRWLMASQSLTAGIQPSYPLAPQQSGPDERVTISGFRTKGVWSSFLSFGLPSVGFDAWGGHDGTPMTLATVWSDVDDYTEIRYRPQLRQLQLVVTANGQQVGLRSINNVWLSKEDRVDVVLSSNGTKTEMTVALPQDSSHPQLQTISVPATMAAPQQIRLSNPNQTKVVPLQWYATHVHPSKFLDANARVQLLGLDELWKV